MASITRFLPDTLKRTVNAAKSAVTRPWEITSHLPVCWLSGMTSSSIRKFLGYSMTRHKAPRLRIASTSLKRLEYKIREVLKGERGRSLTNVFTGFNPILRGWMAYFKLTDTMRT